MRLAFRHKFLSMPWFVTVCIYYFDLTLIKFITQLVKYETNSKRPEPNPSHFHFDQPFDTTSVCDEVRLRRGDVERKKKKKRYLLAQLLDNILFKLERLFLCCNSPNIFTSKQWNQDNLFSVFTLVQILYIEYSILTCLLYRREIYCHVVYVLCAL